MAKQSVAPPVKTDTKQITVDEAEFVRTRDAVVTSWTRLHGALQSAIQAYIEHSNAVLKGEKALDQSSLNLLISAAAAASTSADAALPTTEAAPRDLKFEDDGDKKKRKRSKAPKDPNAPKRPLTAYLLYLAEMRPVIQAQLGVDQRRGDISSEGTKRWNQETEATKEHYKAIYQRNWKEHKKTMADYLAAHPESPLHRAPPEEFDDEGNPIKPKKRAKAKKADAAEIEADAILAPTDEMELDEDAEVDSDAESSVVSSSDSSDDEEDEAEEEASDVEEEAPKLPTPPPAPPAPKRASAKQTAAAKAKEARAAKAEASKAAAVESAAAAVVASSPPRTNKKPKETFTSVNSKDKEKSDSPSKKRKSATTAPPAEEKKEELPKPKKARRGKEVEPEPVEEMDETSKVETPKVEEKKKGRKRKSAAAAAASE
ncbi:hypothetical protein CAC42_6673 [Sphaceloma murrayae]|uniref:HMG box domain-containing protein n=1 Tax=Sphaceloma murrayae TaxID=2082308 RepID=A0A2K1QH01_9PEZI|nr:hypothetical protein CAC42_6673 [Sphaceloma murrayae]